jgi:predicted aspartyl protease
MRTPSLLALAGLLLTPLFAHAADADPPRCRYAKAVDLPIRYVGRYLQPAVDGSVNGTPATLFIDTGSEFTALTMTAVAKRDLSLRPTGIRASGVGGMSRVYAAHVKQLGIGAIKIDKRMDLAVIGDTAEPPEFDVLVGAPFLLMLDLMLDLRDKKLAMYRPQNCEKADLLLWEENTVVLPFKYTNPDKPNPHFTVIVDGKKMDTIIDSGASRSFMSLDAAKRIGFDPKSPTALRLGESSGVGSERAARWTMPVKTVEIGGEKIMDAELGVVDAQGDIPDLLLGQDFLRAHRVLFAMGQEKLYFAYLGGDVFVRGGALEPWMRAEASAGNADAQFALANMFNTGRGAPRDPQQGRIWMDQAAASGQPNAVLTVARREMLAGRVADAIPKMRTALDQLPADRYGPLWLYLARVRNGEADLARTELQAALKKQQDDEWPYPVAQFYLGKWDADKVMREAADDKRQAYNRGCQARSLMAEWQDAHGNQDKAAALREELRSQCAAPRPAPKAASAGAGAGGDARGG